MLHAFLRTHICRYLNEEEADTLMKQGGIRRLTAGEMLFQVGEPGESLFVIVQGRVHVFRVLKGGVTKTLVVLGYGSIIGEVSVIDRQERSASIAALDESALFELSRPQFIAMLKSHPAIAAKVMWAIMETLTVRLRDANVTVQTLLSEKLANLPKTDIV
jgi:CRP-like cAMP-binding protein